jgi:hypothetical protein
MADNTKQKYISIFKEFPGKKNDFQIRPQLLFPRKHLAYVEERLQLALNKKRKK